MFIALATVTSYQAAATYRVANSAAEDAWQLNVNFRTGGERNPVEENV